VTAATILFLALWLPGRAPQTMTQAMPSSVACEAAQRHWLAGEPDAHAIPERPSATRYALCITLPATGHDA
jgi:hypothetical protein